MSTDYTVYQATNPATPAADLEDMATRRPDLRQFVAANPSTASETLEWLGTLGEPAVEAALARRGQASFLPPNPYAQPGTTPPNPYAQPGTTPPNPYAQPAASPTPYFQPGIGTGYPAPPTGHGYPSAEPARGRTGLVVAIVVGALIVLVALGFAASSILGSVGGGDYGDDAHLDRLWDQCAAGDGTACDDLYRQSPLNSEYEEFGDTCGHRFPAQQVWCEDVI